MVTISDIAERAGTSIAAVSLALNGKPGVGPGLREKILALADELGYKRVHRPARVIAILHVSKEGVPLDDHQKSFVADYISGVQFEAGRNGISVDIRFVQNLSPESIGEATESSRAEGVIVLGTELEREDLLLFSDIGRPKVFIDAYYPDLVLDFVDIDNTRAAFDVADYLWKEGHRDIGLVGASEPEPNCRLREGSFSEALLERGLRKSNLRRYAVEPNFEGAYEAMRTLIAHKTVLPTALVCMNDLVALGVLKALREAAIPVPGRVSVVGFDNIGPAAVADPPLTTYEVSKREIGRRALKLLLERIEEKEFRHSEKVMIAGELVLRESSGPAPSLPPRKSAH
jgi:DNA-binding LacI/PurR family transcriptional regulator